MAMSETRKTLNEFLKKKFGYKIFNPFSGKASVLTKYGEELPGTRKIPKCNTLSISLTGNDSIITLATLRKDKETDEVIKVENEISMSISFEELEAIYKIAKELKSPAPAKRKPAAKKVTKKK